MENPLRVWEYEGGWPLQNPANVLTGTINQIDWARQIIEQIDAEFDRVRTVLETAALRQAAQARLNTEAIIRILEDKRAEVMAHSEAGYFIHDWQELRTQVRDLIVED